MKNRRISNQLWIKGLAKISVVLLVAAAGVLTAGANTLIWTNTGGTSWTSGANWNTGTPPGTNDDAQFGLDPTGKSAIGISMSSTSLNNGTNNEAVGAIEQTPARSSNLIITNSSSSASGVLTLTSTTVNNTPNVILRNGSSANLTLADGSSQAMPIALVNQTENVINLDGSGNLTISDAIRSASGSTPLTFAGSGSGTIAITGTGNTFSGNISVVGAEVDFSGDGSLGNVTNNIIVNGGRFASASGTAFTISPTRSVFLGTNSPGVNTGSAISAPGAAGVLTYNGAIADLPGLAGTLNKQGAGRLVLGGASTFSGLVSINNGTLQLAGGDNRLPAGATLYLGQLASANLGRLDLNGNNQQITGLNSNSGENTNTAAKNIVTNSSAAIATLTLSGSGSYAYGDGSTNNSGIIAGPLNLILSGSGTQYLGDSNSTFSGAVTVLRGTLSVPMVNDDSVNGPLGNSTNAVTLGSNGESATLEYTGGAALSSKSFTLASGGTGVFQIDSSGQTLTVSGLVSGGGSLEKTGPGALVLNAAGTYSGNSIIDTGTLALGSAGSLPQSGNIVLSGGAVFDVSALGTFALGGAQTLSNRTSTAVLNGNFNSGSGTVSLTYASGTPAFTISNGTFAVSSETIFKINNTGAPLTGGSYAIISTNVNGNGLVSGATLPSVAVGGNGVTAGATSALQIIGGQLCLVVTSVNTSSPVLTNDFSGGSLNLAWPLDHTGWRLLVQTNHLSAGLSPHTNDWATVAGSAATNRISLPVNQTNALEFYRLVYP